MISLRSLWLVVLLSSTSLGFAQSTFVEVDSTPYDRQMSRIEPTLVASSANAINGLSLALVNEWMIQLRGMPYRYSREWRTPSEVEATKVADCKGKALLLYDRLQLNGAANVRLVIGKRRPNDLLTHTWLEWVTERGTLLLDPTFNWTTTFRVPGERTYIPFYAYDGMRKYQVGNSAMAQRTARTVSPAAPAHGNITRPMRPSSRMRSTSWFDEGPVDPHVFLNRPPL
jgi:predicted transglutaminase-like cysteine proteinase